jgi:hypothetical protein
MSLLLNVPSLNRFPHLFVNHGNRVSEENPVNHEIRASQENNERWRTHWVTPAAVTTGPAAKAADL